MTSVKHGIETPALCLGRQTGCYDGFIQIPEGLHMVEVLGTFKDGVFKPDKPFALHDGTRVRLVIEFLEDEQSKRDEAWELSQRLWSTSNFNSGGDRLTRDQLHERH